MNMLWIRPSANKKLLLHACMLHLKQISWQCRRRFWSHYDFFEQQRLIYRVHMQPKPATQGSPKSHKERNLFFVILVLSLIMQWQCFMSASAVWKAILVNFCFSSKKPHGPKILKMEVRERVQIRLNRFCKWCTSSTGRKTAIPRSEWRKGEEWRREEERWRCTGMGWDKESLTNCQTAESGFLTLHNKSQWLSRHTYTSTYFQYHLSQLRLCAQFYILLVVNHPW